MVKSAQVLCPRGIPFRRRENGRSRSRSFAAHSPVYIIRRSHPRLPRRTQPRPGTTLATHRRLSQPTGRRPATPPLPRCRALPLPDDPEVVQIRLGSVGWTNPRRFGDVWLGLWLWKFLHLDAIVDRHVPQGKETVRAADIVAIEVINRLCAPCSEFTLAEHWYRSTS